MQTDDHKPALWRKPPSRLWNPQPIQPPKVDRELTKLPPIERSAEVIRYSVLKAEFWISRRGALREWLRINCLGALVIGIPALFIIPIITFILGQFVTWMAFLALAAWNLVRFIGSVIAAIALITSALAVFRGTRGR